MEHLAYAAVVLDDALDRILDYSIPESLRRAAIPGSRVSVSVRGHLRKGTILALKEKPDVLKTAPLSAILSEKPLLSQELLNLAEWISRYYAAPLFKTLRMFLPPSVRRGAKEKMQLFVKPLQSPSVLAEQCAALRTAHPAQGAALDTILKYPKGVLLSQLLEESGCSRSPVAQLEKKKMIQLSPLAIDRSPLDGQEYFPTKEKQLNPEQSSTFQAICSTLGQFAVHLIHGVTGSGKTEIYLQAIERALQKNLGALFLVPEIALTSQMIEKLRGRFGLKIAILHHRLSDGERLDSWKKIHSGEIRIAIGARSAVFSPIQHLGLIIVDEEHEASYKQSDEMPCYHARDIAIVRAKLCGATVILGSATPSLESYQNALSGKYRLHSLTFRADSAQIPLVKIVNIQSNKGFTLFSEPLLEALKTRWERGEQSLIFLNRRGYHTSQLCSACLQAMHCPHCTVSLTFHRGANTLACHLCDYKLSPPPRSCPHCGKEDSLRFKGVGTEQVERALHALFPHIRTLRLDADTTRHKGSHEQLFKQFRSGKADVLIGTQMIAKGLHFSSVTLVAVLHADAGLHIPDFRAQEQTFQLLTQVAGRAGRGKLPGAVIFQTTLPKHPVILHAAEQDYLAFAKEELEGRALFHFPPFTHLVKIVLSGKEEGKTLNEAEHLRTRLIHLLPPECSIQPVIPSGHAKVKDDFRFQFLVKGEKIALIAQTIRALPPPKSCRLFIDIDPLSTFF